jgi:hypothetical protein
MQRSDGPESSSRGAEKRRPDERRRACSRQPGPRMPRSLIRTLIIRLTGRPRLSRAIQNASAAYLILHALRSHAMTTSADSHLVVLGIPFPDAHRACLAPPLLPSRTSISRRTPMPLRQRAPTCSDAELTRSSIS